jgi:prepilin-type N-terminal cleavage/methylation domain-containing protein
MMMRRRAFTLLEIMIAVAILAGALTVLVHAQATAVLMTTETEKLLIATMLAKEKMAEVQLMMESEGFGEQDIEEDGDFDDFGDMEGLDLNLDVDDEYDSFEWAYTVREIELDLGGDFTGMAEDLAGQGYWGEQDYDQEGSSSSSSSTSGRDAESQQPGLDDMGVSSDMITELLGGYIREVRVLVWWGENDDELDQVEITTHVINSSALTLLSAAMGGSSSGGSSGSKSGSGSSGSSGGSSGVQGGGGAGGGRSGGGGGSGGGRGGSSSGGGIKIPGTPHTVPTGGGKN